MDHELAFLGWTPFFEEQRARWPELIPARVAAEHRGAYEVWSATSSGQAKLAGRLRHEAGESGLPGVGDWVALDATPGADRTAIIHHVFDRQSVFTRGAAGRETRAQVVAANVDLVFVVCGLDEDFNVRRIERYVARVWASGAQPLVVLSKADLVDDPAPQLDEVRRHTPGVEVVALSALRGAGVELLRARMRTDSARTVTAALVGSSGAGKSTLVNALAGEDLLATGAVRARDGRGRHVTTTRQLVLLPGGGLLIDTPGMRELQLLDEEGLRATFDDIATLARGCRFSDCTHGAEPGCAVRAAIADGSLELDRLEHFLQLQREARAWERRHDVRLRREDERAWGRLTQEAHRQMRRKRGD